MIRQPEETSLHFARARDGEPASREWLAEHLYPMVLAHAHMRMRGDGRAFSQAPDEVADCVMMTLMERLGDLRERNGRIGPVVRVFLRNTLLQHLSNLRRASARDRLVVVPGAERVGDRVPASTTGLSSRFARAERASALTEALATLPRADREVLIARFWEEEPWEAISERTGINVVALRKRGERALKRLKAQLPASVAEELLA